MIEAIVGVALRAILASVLLGAVLSGLVLIATRRLALTAATRHALWTTAMIATAAMPLAGIAVSLARATTAQTAPASTAPRTPATTHWAEPPLDRALRTAAGQPAHTGTANGAANNAQPAGAATPAQALGWTPRVTRALAIGVVAMWSLGVLIGMIGLAASVMRIRGLKRRSSPLDGALADELPWLTAAGAGREIYLRLSYEIETPVAIGFGRPVILVPTELAGDGGLATLEPLVLHEHAHLRRYDDWTNLVQRTIERVFWFNPIVWLVGRRIALEREIASDDAVVEKTGEAHAYATSLWRLAREMRMPEHAVVAPGALLTRKQIAVRIEELLDANRGRRRRSPAAALATALAGIGAVAFVATSAPAIELPAGAEPPVPASVSAVTAHAAPRTPRHVVRRPAALAASRPAVAQHPAAQSTTVRPRTLIVYVQVPAKPVPAKDTAPKRIAAARQVRESQGTIAGAPALPASPRLPALPDMPEAPPVAVPAPPPPAPGAHTLSPRTLATIRSVAGRGSASAAAFGAQIGADVAGSVGQVLAHLPREIAQLDAQDGMPSHHVPPNGAKLSRELLASCNACSFRGADLHGMDLHEITLKGDDFSGADLRGANLAGASLIGVSLREANLGNADLRRAHLTGVELRGASLAGARLDGVTLTGISLRGPGVSGVPVRTILSRCTGCDLARLDLHGQDLHGISLADADLSYANLHGANLSGAHLTGVDLSGADLFGADLTNAHLDGCDLRGVSLHDALTTGMTTHGSSLDG